MSNKKGRNVARFYDIVAARYDEEFVAVMDYQIPGVLLGLYDRYGIEGGSVLDTGCGTGHLGELLGSFFTCSGIDISGAMVAIARNRYETVWHGDVRDVIVDLADNAFDHVVGLSWLPFLSPDDFVIVVKEFLRIARCSVFFSCEQSDERVTGRMLLDHGICLYNHDVGQLEVEPTETYTGYLWKAHDGTKVFGTCFFLCSSHLSQYFYSAILCVSRVTFAP